MPLDPEAIVATKAPPSSARWRSGYAEDCKSLHAGSIPARASTPLDFSFNFNDLRKELSNRLSNRNRNPGIRPPKRPATLIMSGFGQCMFANGHREHAPCPTVFRCTYHGEFIASIMPSATRCQNHQHSNGRASRNAAADGLAALHRLSRIFLRQATPWTVSR